MIVLEFCLIENNAADKAVTYNTLWGRMTHLEDIPVVIVIIPGIGVCDLPSAKDTCCVGKYLGQLRSGLGRSGSEFLGQDICLV